MSKEAQDLVFKAIESVSPPAKGEALVINVSDSLAHILDSIEIAVLRIELEERIDAQKDGMSTLDDLDPKATVAEIIALVDSDLQGSAQDVAL